MVRLVTRSPREWFVFVIAAVMVAAALRMTLFTGDASAAQVGSSHSVTRAEFERWKKELSNWGRWGKDDQIGAMNLITPAKKKQAAALVKERFSVSLAVDADTEQSIDNPDPYEHTMLSLGGDKLGIIFHHWAHTHIDSLAHVNYNGVFYNGYTPDKDVVMREGHAKNSIHNLKNGIFTRGILIDIPRLRGVPYLEPGTPIYVEDLEAFERMAGIKVSAGDALFIRTGVWPYRKKFGPWERGRGGKQAGLHASVIPWLKQRDIAIMGHDGQNQVAPSEIPGAVHDFPMVTLGVHLFDNCDLEAVGEAAAARKRWEFLLTAAPLPVRGGTGSPMNPIATF